MEKHELSPGQHKALHALLSAVSIVQAAEKAGVDERTLRGWLKTDDAFIREYRAARRDAVEHAIGLMQKATVSAVGVLVNAMKSEDQYLAVRAAIAILDHAIAGGEFLDLVERVEALEERESKKPARRR